MTLTGFLLGFTGFYWVWKGLKGFGRVFTGFYWIFNGFGLVSRVFFSQPIKTKGEALTPRERKNGSIHGWEDFQDFFLHQPCRSWWPRAGQCRRVSAAKRGSRRGAARPRRPGVRCGWPSAAASLCANTSPSLASAGRRRSGWGASSVRSSPFPVWKTVPNRWPRYSFLLRLEADLTEISTHWDFFYQVKPNESQDNYWMWMTEAIFIKRTTTYWKRIKHDLDHLIGKSYSVLGTRVHYDWCVLE